MTMSNNIALAIQAIGVSIKDVRSRIGVLANLNTTDKTDTVQAINEVKAALDANIQALGQIINDAAGLGDTTHTWSVDQIITYVQNIRSDILGGIPPSALDSIYELAQQIEADGSSLDLITQALNFRVRVDAAQTFDATERAQGRANIGAAADADLQQLITDVGDTTTDYVAVFNTGLA